MSKNEITLTPYLSFKGDCEEALKTYQKILNGTYEIVQRYDNPAMKAPEEYKNKVLHSFFRFGTVQMFASDTFHGQAVNETNPNVALSLDVADVEKAKQIFDKLAEGGKVGVPFAKQFWGAWHGNLVDRFGIKWMLNVG